MGEGRGWEIALMIVNNPARLKTPECTNHFTCHLPVGICLSFPSTLSSVH